MKILRSLLMISLFILPHLIKAQSTNYGLKGGVNISSLTGGDVDRNNLFGLHFGGFAEFELGSKFSFQPEILYSMQGSEADNELKVKLNYIAVPLSAKYYLSDKFGLEAGPQLSFLINDKIEFNDSAIPDAETDAASFDFGFNFGLGYKIDAKIFAQLRYNLGITPVSENPDINNSVFQISFGYSL